MKGRNTIPGKDECISTWKGPRRRLVNCGQDELGKEDSGKDLQGLMRHSTP